MIPLCLVTGFLGSGKTTFLRQVAGRHAGRRFAYIVNDFGSVDIDARLLAGIGDQVVSLPGGSIFCTCLVTGFIGAMRRVAALHEKGPPVEGVVIEASGMADPRVVGELLQDTGLDAVFHLASVVSLVDPGSFRKVLATLPAVAAQIEASDVALVNKCDLHDEASLSETEAALRRIRPAIAIVRCCQGAAAVDLFQGTSHATRIHGTLAGCRDPSFLSGAARFRRGARIDPAAVLGLLDRHADRLLRAKGFVPSPAGFVEVEWTLGGAAQRAAPPRTRLGALVLIARGGAAGELDELIAALQAL